MQKSCPQIKTCALFNNLLLKSEDFIDTYKDLYCHAGEIEYSACKRFIVTNKVGTCADFVMPNSSYTVEQIIKKMKDDKII